MVILTDTEMTFHRIHLFLEKNKQHPLIKTPKPLQRRELVSLNKALHGEQIKKAANVLT